MFIVKTHSFTSDLSTTTPYVKLQEYTFTDYHNFLKATSYRNERAVTYLTFSWARLALFAVILAVRAMKPLSVFSAILDSTFDRWHDSAHAWDHKNNMADFMGDEEPKFQYFPDGSLLNTMIISIIDTEKRYTDILKEPYTVYLIETKWVFVF